MWNNALNIAIIEWLNQYASFSPKINHIINFVAGAYLFKGLPMMSLLWFFWFRDTNPNSDTRRIIIATLIGCLGALFIARLGNTLAPYQPRPFANNELSFHPLAGLPEPESQGLFDWNSFPSDHATLFCALATGIFLISRKVGYLTFLYITVVILMPRIYLGLHYPTDILVGACLGIMAVRLSANKSVEKLYSAQCMKLLSKYPAAFQTALFMLSVEMVVMFDDAKRVIKGVIKYLG